MNWKNVAVKGAMITTAATVISGLAILNYDKHPFYQEDLDNAYRKVWCAERAIDAELTNIYDAAYEEAKTYPEYKQMDSFARIHAQNPELNWELEYKIDSLWNTIDSTRNAIMDRRIENSIDLEHAYKKLETAEAQVDKLTQDSIMNDSINSQPLRQRFKNNWNKIFCQQKQK